MLTDVLHFMTSCFAAQPSLGVRCRRAGGSKTGIVKPGLIRKLEYDVPTQTTRRKIINESPLNINCVTVVVLCPLTNTRNCTKSMHIVQWSISLSLCLRPNFPRCHHLRRLFSFFLFQHISNTNPNVNSHSSRCRQVEMRSECVCVCGCVWDWGGGGVMGPLVPTMTDVQSNK